MEDDVVLIADYAHPACGILSEETKQVIGLCARLDGTMTDPVHEGESMQGTIDLVKKVFFERLEGALRSSRRCGGDRGFDRAARRRSSRCLRGLKQIIIGKRFRMKCRQLTKFGSNHVWLKRTARRTCSPICDRIICACGSRAPMA